MNSNLLRNLKRTGLIVACGGAAAAACNVYDSSLLVESDAGAGASGGTAGSAGSGGTGGSSGNGGTSTSTDPFWQDTEVGDPPVCPTEGRPEKSMRPEDTDPAELTPFYVAFNRVRFGAITSLDDMTQDLTAWQNVGFNLDLACNAASWPDGVLMGGAVDACPAAREKACTNAIQNNFDGAYCRDNVIGSLFGTATMSPVLGEPFRLSEPDYNCAMHRGSMSIIFKVSNYNGQLNDSSVRLDLYSSVGVTEAAAWNCRADESASSQLLENWESQAPQPLTKRWQFASRDLDPAAPDPGANQIENSKWADPAAYVRNGWLIANLPPNAEIWFNGLNAHTRGIRLTTQNSLIAAQLKLLQTEKWAITHGIMGGTIKPGDMITSFREIGFCENGCDSYATTIGYMNAGVDMLSNSNDAVPDAMCNALSFGIEFKGNEVTPGPVVNVPAPVDCPEPPNHEEIGRQGCTCPPVGLGGPCISPDGG